MPRDIPESVPDQIRDLIYGTWGDMKSFASSCGLKYTTVHSILSRSEHRILRNLKRIAKSLSVSEDDLADILLSTPIDARKSAIKELAVKQGMSSLSDIARGAEMSPQDFNTFLTSELTQLKSLCTVTRQLGLDLKRFRKAYTEHLANVS